MFQVVKPHLWPRIKILSSGGHESQHDTWLAAANFQQERQFMEHTSESNLVHLKLTQQCKATTVQFKVKTLKIKTIFF